MTRRGLCQANYFSFNSKKKAPSRPSPKERKGEDEVLVIKDAEDDPIVIEAKELVNSWAPTTDAPVVVEDGEPVHRQAPTDGPVGVHDGEPLNRHLYYTCLE